MTDSTRDNPVLDACLERIHPLAADEQLAALRRILMRQSALAAGVAAAMAQITDGASLVVAMARPDDAVARSLSLLILAEVDPTAALPLLAEAKVLFDREQARCVLACVRALPRDLLDALATARGVPVGEVEETASAVAALYDTALYHSLYSATSTMPDREEGQRIWALFQAPAVVSTPAWLVQSGLQGDVDDRTMTLSALLARVRTNNAPWSIKSALAQRPELKTTAAQVTLLAELADEVAKNQLEWTVVWLIEQIGSAKGKDIDPLLGRVLRDHPEKERGVAALKALGARKGAAAREALLARVIASDVAEPTVLDLRLCSLATRALIAGDPNDLGWLDRFAMAETSVGRAVRDAAFSTVAGVPRKKWEASLDRWAALAVPHLDGPADGARELLNLVPEDKLATLLARPAPTVSRPLPASPRWLERYRSGEHEAVWRELREAGVAVHESDEAKKVARLTMEGAKREIARVISILRDDGYPFSDVEPMPGPSTSTGKDLAALEKALGGPLPLSFRAFHEVVGAVNLARSASAMSPSFPRIEWCDPLQIAPSFVTRDFAVDAVKAAKKKWIPALRRPPALFFGMSPSRKADPDREEDEPYMLHAAGEGADAAVRQWGRPAIAFLDYLRETIRSGGFTRLDTHDHAAEARARLTIGALPF